ncbi:hypothetical protein GCM10009117_25940 [Gangjinia marincola]|uniref:DUF3667 domain-containing protein n=1 Tax=Gangjinia marincola TaxID=578463 RepID=A0ABN1MKD5_9FLAO
MWEDFADRFLNLENSFLKTFIAMFIKPEDVIGSYINGTRKRYLTAFSYFAISATIAGLYSWVILNYFPDYMTAGSEFFDTGPEELKEKQIETTSNLVKFMTDYTAVVSFLTIPILALISKVVFWKGKGYNYIEHFVIYLYSYSHIAMITYVCAVFAAFALPPNIYMWVSPVFSLIYLIYHIYILKRLFELSKAEMVLKTLIFFIVGGILLAAVMALIIIILIKIGFYDEIWEAARQQAEAAKAAKGS